MIVYVKVTALDLAPEFAVSIYSSICESKTPEAHIKLLQRRAAKNGVRALYELSDRAAYDAHYSRLRAEHAAARAAK